MLYKCERRIQFDRMGDSPHLCHMFKIHATTSGHVYSATSLSFVTLPNFYPPRSATHRFFKPRLLSVWFFLAQPMLSSGDVAVYSSKSDSLTPLKGTLYASDGHPCNLCFPAPRRRARFGAVEPFSSGLISTSIFY